MDALSGCSAADCRRIVSSDLKTRHLPPYSARDASESCGRRVNAYAASSRTSSPRCRVRPPWPSVPPARSTRSSACRQPPVLLQPSRVKVEVALAADCHDLVVTVSRMPEALDLCPADQVGKVPGGRLATALHRACRSAPIPARRCRQGGSAGGVFRWCRHRSRWRCRRYLRLHAMLRREGLVANRKRTYRLYTEEGLQVRTKKRRKLPRRDRISPQVPERPIAALVPRLRQ